MMQPTNISYLCFINLLVLITAIPHVGHAGQKIVEQSKICQGTTFELHGVSVSGAKLDYQADFLILKFGPTDGLQIHGFNLRKPYAMDDAVFLFGNESLCTRELIALGFDLNGTDKAEIIRGTGASNRITGGGGDDVLVGGDSDDTFFYNMGDGRDCISDRGGRNVVVFGYGIGRPQISITKVIQQGELIARIRLTAPDGRVLKNAGMDILLSAQGKPPIDEFRFADGEIYSWEEISKSASVVDQRRAMSQEDKICIFDIFLAKKAGFEEPRARRVKLPMPLLAPSSPPEPKLPVGCVGPDVILVPEPNGDLKCVRHAPAH